MFLNNITNIVKKLFINEKKIFGHKADGELCCVCMKPMHTKQGVTMVGNGDKMHSKCWSNYFSMKTDAIVKGVTAK